MSSNIKKSAYNIFFGIGSQVLIAVVGMLLPRLFITNFGSETNGFLSSIRQIFTYITLLEAGVGTAALQALYKPVANKDHDKINGILSATGSFYKKTGIAYMGCIVLMAVIYPLFVKSDIVWWKQVLIILITGSSGSLTYFFYGKYRMLLRAEGKQYIYTNAFTITQISINLSKVLLILLTKSIVVVQLGQIVLNICLTMYYMWYVKRHYKWINPKVKPDNEAISQKNSVLVHEISQMIFNHTDVLVLTTFANLKVVSVYVLYNTMVDIISTLIGNINNGFTFRMGQLYNTDKNRYIRMYDDYETCYMALSFALYCVLFLFLSPFMSIYTRGVTDISYVDRYLPLLFVTVKILVSGRAIAGATITYAGEFKNTRVRALIEAGINLSVSIVAVIFFGIYGVLFGTIAALLYRANDMILYTNMRLLHRSAWPTYSRWLVNIATFVAIWLLSRLTPIPANGYLELVLYAAVFTVAVLAIFALVNFLVFPKRILSVAHYATGILRKRRKNKSTEGLL